MIFSARRDHYEDSDAPERILGAMQFYHDLPLLFVAVGKLPVMESSQLEAKGVLIQPLAQFTGAEGFAEDFYLYRLEMRGSAQGQQQCRRSLRLSGYVEGDTRC